MQSRAQVYNEAETTWPVDFGFNITKKAEVLIDYTCYPVNNKVVVHVATYSSYTEYVLFMHAAGMHLAS